jgi:hypothetical protein
MKKEVNNEVAAYRAANPTATSTLMKKFESTTKSKLKLNFITEQCYQDLSLICKGVPELLEYILPRFSGSQIQPRLITQDILEGDFSVLRTRAGSGMNPTVYDAAYCLKSINVNRLSSL